MCLERQLKGKETFSKLLLSTAFTIWSRKGPNKQNTRQGKHRQKIGKKRARRDGLARSASHWAAKRGGWEPPTVQFGAQGKKVIKGVLFFLSPIVVAVVVFPEIPVPSKFWQLWNMSADSENSSNVPQMTRNEKPNPEIGWVSKVADNHCHKSPRHINLWLQEVLQVTNNARQKAHAGKGCPLWMRQADALLSGLSLQLQRLQLCRA